MNIPHINQARLLHRMQQSREPLVPQAFKVLVFSKTSGYRHDSIPAGMSGLQRLAERSTHSSVSPAPFTIDVSEDAAIFDAATLEQYRVLVLLQTSGEFLDAAQLEALKAFTRGGGGVVGIHCASNGMPSRDVDTEGWYGRLIGGNFTDHPKPQAGLVRVVDPGHVILSRGDGLKGLTKVGSTEDEYVWDLFDEWYNFKVNPRENGVNVLLTVDESSYEGGKLGQDHPIAWCQEFEGARSLYTALGHFDEAYEDETLMAQLLNGILWSARLIG